MSGAGVTAFAASPAFRLHNIAWHGLGYGWSPLMAPEVYEFALSLLLVLAYLSNRWRIPGVLIVIALVAHCMFWFFGFKDRFFFGGYAPLGTLFGGLAWIFYRREASRSDNVSKA